MKKSGFTLIELLVVISIIAVLSTIGFVVYTSVLKQGRDAKRQSDLGTIQSALEQYRSDQGFYPTSLAFGSAFNNCTGNPAAGCATTKTYLNTIPADPTGSPQYAYTALPSTCDNSTTKCVNYCLYALLENSNPGLPAICTDTSYNFAVTPP